MTFAQRINDECLDQTRDFDILEEKVSEILLERHPRRECEQPEGEEARTQRYRRRMRRMRAGRRRSSR